jgi:hypothetical protein
MRLLHVQNVKLSSFETSQAPPYAILSHTWGAEEVSFQELTTATRPFPRRNGWTKILGACRKARRARFEWIWIDTCCIDKSSSAELSEAINSMFRWYERAKVCYAYLEDVAITQAVDSGQLEALLRPALWFTRGWTLQELIASPEVEFCNVDWKTFGTRSNLSRMIALITGIDQRLFLGEKDLSHFSIAQRMSWAAERQTSREEDVAYCLMGVFGVNMPLLYGEGPRAFIRLQEEIVRESEDQSIFVWEYVELRMMTNKGIFAEHPKAFRKSYNALSVPSDLEPFSITNRGLRMHAQIMTNYNDCQFVLVLSCHQVGNQHTQLDVVGIPLQQISQTQTKFYRDTSKAVQLIPPAILSASPSLTTKTIFVQKFGLASNLPPLTRSVFLGFYPSGMNLMEVVYYESEIPGKLDARKVHTFLVGKVILKMPRATAYVVFSFEYKVMSGGFKVLLLIDVQKGSQVGRCDSDDTGLQILERMVTDGYLGVPDYDDDTNVTVSEVISPTEHSYVLQFAPKIHTITAGTDSTRNKFDWSNHRW